MSRATLDASVILKWYLQVADECDSIQARGILDQLLADDMELVQPAHCLLEVASVLARLDPAHVVNQIADLDLLLEKSSSVDSVALLQQAAALAQELNAHLFDTLYHVVAIEAGATLITANEKYYKSAARLGNIVLLRHFSLH